MIKIWARQIYKFTLDRVVRSSRLLNPCSVAVISSQAVRKTAHISQHPIIALQFLTYSHIKQPRKPIILEFDPTYSALWCTPCISYRDQWFFLITTDVTRKVINSHPSFQTKSHLSYHFDSYLHFSSTYIKLFMRRS